MTAEDLDVRVAVVGDSVDWPHWIADRPHHHPRLFVIDVPPLTHASNVDVAEAVLAGLGKDRRLGAARRKSEATAAAWLSVTDRTDALVADATVLPAPVLDDLVLMLTAFGIRPWLVVPWGDFHDPDERVALADGLVERFDGRLLGPDELVASWPDANPAPETAEVVDDWPIVPRVDGVFFRSAVRDLLDPDDAAFVDKVFRETVTAIRAELSDSEQGTRTRVFEKVLRNRMHEAVTDEELVTVVRAAQVAGLTAGFHVAVNPLALHGASAVIPRRGLIVAEDWWAKLDRYPDADVPAVAALHMAGMDLADIRTLTTDDVVAGADGTVTVTGASGAQATLSGMGGKFVRAAANWRCFGAGPGPLFATHRDESISEKRIGYLARAPMEVGVRHTGPKAFRSEPTARNWLATFGVTVERSRAPAQ